MALTFPQINLAAGGDTYNQAFVKVNAVINALGNNFITANSTVGGSISVGNALLVGNFSANSFNANSIGGGNNTVSAPLTVTTNVKFDMATYVANTLSIGNATVNTIITGNAISTLEIDVATANIVAADIDVLSVNSFIGTGNTNIQGVLSVGNATANMQFTGTFLTVGLSKVNASSFSVGNNSVNCVINSSSIMFSNTSGVFVLDAGASVSNSFFNSLFKFGTANTTGTTAQTIDSYDKTITRSCEYLVSIKDKTANQYQTSKLLVTFDDSNTSYTTEYGTVASNVSLGIFQSTTNATHVIVQLLPTSTATTVTFSRTTLGV